MSHVTVFFQANVVVTKAHVALLNLRNAYALHTSLFISTFPPWYHMDFKIISIS